MFKPHTVPDIFDFYNLKKDLYKNSNIISENN